ncbi:hypothetical protein NDU88_008230 [Pleurodeles waltl]|uniref:Uncharacterized protein n=1 Tax=Pleurodeles waltl TaxID=8319 RepID=A0AAV7N879_PLEWA|nr:hypothetical protein NDU88_008230 [Pleurodeles waltl]
MGPVSGPLVICRGLKLLRSPPHRHLGGERRPAAPSPIAGARAPLFLRELRRLRPETHSVVQSLPWPRVSLLGPTTHWRQAHQSAGGKLFSQPRPPLAPLRGPAPIPGPISVSPRERCGSGQGPRRAATYPQGCFKVRGEPPGFPPPGRKALLQAEAADGNVLARRHLGHAPQI